MRRFPGIIEYFNIYRGLFPGIFGKMGDLTGIDGNVDQIMIVKVERADG